jgi:signal peptidase I
MAKKKPNQTRRDAPVPAPATTEVAGNHSFLIFRETVESIVVAFVLAFLFRTFEAEAFVIPTGSMSPSLQGRHKDVECVQCGMRFRTSASSEDPEEFARRRTLFRSLEEAEVVGGMCPMCRYPMPYTNRLPRTAQAEVSLYADLDDVETQTGYPGDRILVNKYGYDFSEPERWDVVVFKFPGDGEMNYIKRLVGLPGEELRIYQGDVFTRSLSDRQAGFKIARKPADKVEAMLQLVHDTDYESSTLNKAKWPLRWAPLTADGWKVSAEPGDKTVAVRYSVNTTEADPPAWLRYRHLLPGAADWAIAVGASRSGSVEKSLRDVARLTGETDRMTPEGWADSIHPQLIADFNSYNALVYRAALDRNLSFAETLEDHAGRNWVGDLAVEAEVSVEEARGELLLDLVEAGYHFQATIDLKSGNAKLAIIDARTGRRMPFEAEAETPITKAGDYTLRLANVDDQLLLWVNGEQVEFVDSTYEPDELFAASGGRRGMIPWADVSEGGDQGDLTPAGVGARGAKLSISRLALLRDVYYIATNDESTSDNERLMDYDLPLVSREIQGERAPALGNFQELLRRSDAWAWFRTRRPKEFTVKAGQLFVMGDNSPESADCRLWAKSGLGGVPGGRYLDRRLVIGKAVCVFWPHSWGGIPGLPKLPGFPGFGDMRLVR